MPVNADLGHGFVRDTIRLGAFAQDGLVQGRPVEPERDLLLAHGNFLPLKITERLRPKECTVSNGYSQEERRVVIDEFFVLFLCRIEYHVLRVAVVLHPSLADVLNKPPSTNRHSLQYEIDILIAKSVREKGT
jgi:hypothetical protein